MRIFQVLHGQPTVDLNNSQVWIRNLYEPLLDLGHEVVLFSSEEGIRARKTHNVVLRSKFSQNVLATFRKLHKQKPFDLFFSYLMDGMIDEQVIDEIRNLGVITLNFSCNNVHQFELTDGLAPHFDYNLHSEKNVASKFKEIGANPVWFPMGANPKYYYPMDLPQTIDVSFIGQRYAKRPFYIWHLLENRVNVEVFGPGWRLKKSRNDYRKFLRSVKRIQLIINTFLAKTLEQKAETSAHLAWLDFAERLRLKYDAHMHEPLPDDEVIRTYSQSKVSLGFLDVYKEHHHSEITLQHLHLRDFEAPMSGAVYLTGFCDELCEFYEPDKEVMVYRNEFELVDKVNFLLKHPEFCSKVRQAGRNRSLQGNTYHARFTNLFKMLNLSPNLQ